MESVKNKSIILCEGPTDAILIGFYLEKVCNLKLNKLRGQVYTQHSFILPSGKIIKPYEYVSEITSVLVLPVGGVSNLPKVLDSILELNYYEMLFSKIMIITDHDSDKEISDRFSTMLNTIRAHKDWFSDLSCLEHSSKGEWINLLMFDNTTSSDGNPSCCPFSLYFMAIPLDEEGCLETFVYNAILQEDDTKAQIINSKLEEKLASKKDVMLDTIKERAHEEKVEYKENVDSQGSMSSTQKGKKFLQTQINDFVEIVSKETDFLQSRSEYCKSKLSIAISVMEPEKGINSIQKILKAIDFQKYQTFNQQFKELETLCSGNK